MIGKQKYKEGKRTEMREVEMNDRRADYEENADVFSSGGRPDKKEKAKKWPAWLASGVMIAAALAVICSIFLTYFKLDFVDFGSRITKTAAESSGSSVVRQLAEAVSLQAEELISQTISCFSGKESDLVLSLSGTEIIKNVQDFLENLNKYPRIKWILICVLVMIILPVICALLAFIFSWFRKKWSYITACACGMVGLIGTLVSALWLFPASIYHSLLNVNLAHISGLIGKSISNESWLKKITELAGNMADAGEAGKVKDIAHQLSLKESDVRSFVLKGLGPAFWICIAGLFVLVMAAVVGIIIAKEAEGFQAGTYPAVVCHFGNLAEAEIPVPTEAGKFLTIGSDSECNLIIDELAPLHCAIRWDKKQQNYLVVNPEKGKVFFANGREIKQGGSITLKSGETICLGKMANKVEVL